MLILEALKWFALCWVIVSWLSFLFERYINEKFFYLLCIKCITFWLTLLVVQDVFIASLAALMAFLFDTYLNK